MPMNFVFKYICCRPKVFMILVEILKDLFGKYYEHTKGKFGVFLFYSGRDVKQFILISTITVTATGEKLMCRFQYERVFFLKNLQNINIYFLLMIIFIFYNK